MRGESSAPLSVGCRERVTDALHESAVQSSRHGRLEAKHEASLSLNGTNDRVGGCGTEIWVRTCMISRMQLLACCALRLPTLLRCGWELMEPPAAAGMCCEWCRAPSMSANGACCNSPPLNPL
jgi:hypothetical protein